MKRTILVCSLLASQMMIAVPAFAIPAGSYTRSCRGIEESIYINGAGRSIGRLSASCRNLNGKWVNTYLDNYRYCSGIIANHNGRLVCEIRR